MGHELVGVSDCRSALNGQEVAETHRCKPGDELYPEDISLLDFDIQPRRGEDVVGGEVEVVNVADTDAWNDVAVRRQSDRTPGGRHVQRVGAGGVGRTRGNEHHHRRDAIVWNDHAPDGRLGRRDVGQRVPVAVALEQTGAGQEAPTSTVDHQGLVDGVRQRLLRLSAVGSKALTLAGGRRTHGVVQTRSRVDCLFHPKIRRQLEQTICRSDVHLYTINRTIRQSVNSSVGISLKERRRGFRYRHM